MMHGWSVTSLPRAGPVTRLRSGVPLRTRASLAVVVAMLGACTATTQSLPGNTASHEQRPPRYNLAGYPPSFRDGFNAACDAARRHAPGKSDPARYAADAQYRQGWKDGSSICKQS